LLAPQAIDDLFRLAVFTSSFSLEAAVAILGATPSAVLERLGRLRDCSLLVAETQGAAGRFRLLEPVRQYAAEHLHGQPYEKDTRRRHAQHVLTRSQWIGARLLGTPEQAAALAAFEELVPDIRQATMWSFENQPAYAAQIVGHTGWAWEITSRLREGEALERRALEVATSTADHARLLTRLGSLLVRRTMVRNGAGIGADSIAEARKAADRHELALALCLSTDDKMPEVSSSRLR
jgi:predicted ATPase